MALAAVRSADVTDVDEIVRIQGATWAAAYTELLPAEALERLGGSGARQAWTAAVSAGPGHHVFVATEGDWTVGFCAASTASSVQPAEPELEPTAWAEIGALLVEPRWGRRGHAGRLLATTAAALRANGARFGLAWIPEQDGASRGFYARAGWEPDGAVRALDTGNGIVREVRVTGSLDLKLQPEAP
jgi:GNAT superfamily N-acetyltransferase